MFKEFPILEETMKKRGLNIQNIQSDYLETFLKAVNQ
jgi:hypothetical protein